MLIVEDPVSNILAKSKGSTNPHNLVKATMNALMSLRDVHEIAAWDLVNVEAIPIDVLSKGVTWDWETFPEYMDAAERRGSGGVSKSRNNELV